MRTAGANSHAKERPAVKQLVKELGKAAVQQQRTAGANSHAKERDVWRELACERETYAAHCEHSSAARSEFAHSLRDSSLLRTREYSFNSALIEL